MDCYGVWGELTLVWQFSSTSLTSRSLSSLWYCTFSSMSAIVCFRFSISFCQTKAAKHKHECRANCQSVSQVNYEPDVIPSSHWFAPRVPRHDSVHFRGWRSGCWIPFGPSSENRKEVKICWLWNRDIFIFYFDFVQKKVGTGLRSIGT